MFCDPLEGVVAIPRELLKQVVKILPTLVEADDRVKEEVRKGESVVVAFEKHRG